MFMHANSGCNRDAIPSLCHPCANGLPVCLFVCFTYRFCYSISYGHVWFLSLPIRLVYMVPILAAILVYSLSGCSQSRSPEPPVEFPIQFVPILVSPLFVDPQAPYSKSPVDDFYVRYATELAANFSVDYDTRADFLVGGRGSSSIINNVLKSYIVYTLQKPSDPILRSQQQVNIDFSTVSVMAVNQTVNECVSLLPEAWSGYTSFSLDGYENSGAETILQAVNEILHPDDTIIGLRTFSAVGSAFFLSYDANMFYAQTMEGA